MALTQAAWFRFNAECDRLGLHHRVWGTVADAGLPDAADGSTHAVLVGQPGGEYWRRMQSQRAVDSELAAHADPLDTFTVRNARRLAGLLDGGFRAVRFPFDEQPLDFVGIAKRLGGGAPSRLTILIHPEYGPWFAFRALFLVDDPQGVTGASPRVADSPCETCAAPCRAACPAGAIRADAAGVERLDYPHSFRFRVEHPGTCETACAARLACPVGSVWRYPADFIEAAHRRAWAVGSAWVATAPAKGLGKTSCG